ncbi:class I adenylate-forming enzyme family protein [Oryzobacter telluris]|uniref:class I adenylate-forming enzyme family protein n=1 Tax=Oryzobacter telluris TaxID=3149179 RepID=UPI00370DCDAE
MSPDRPRTLGALLEHCASRFEGRTAIVAPDARLTFEELFAASTAVSARLISLGVGRGTRVGILLPQSAAWVATFLGVARIGAVGVLLSSYATPDETRTVLDASDVEVLVAASVSPLEPMDLFLERAFPELSLHTGPVLAVGGAPRLRTIELLEPTDAAWAAVAGSELTSDEAVADMALDVSPRDPVVVICTSGSTGRPKCVVHSQGACVRQGDALASAMRRTASDRVLVAMPLFWVGGLAVGLLSGLAAGAEILLQERFDADGSVDLIAREGVTDVVGWSTVHERLAAVSVGRPADTATLRRPLAAAFDGTRARMEGLGMTETLGPHSYLGISDDTVEQDRAGSVGEAIGGFERRIVEPDSGRPCAAMVVGEICVRGPNLMIGMVGVEQDRLLDDSGWFHTGDLGYLSQDGELFFVGRHSGTIKVRGMNVSPAEVEAVLLRHPDVTHAVVTSDFVDGDDRLVASVALRSPVTADELMSWSRRHLASYKVPRHIAVSLRPAPLLPNGKLDRTTLAQAARTPQAPTRQG